MRSWSEEGPRDNHPDQPGTECCLDNCLDIAGIFNVKLNIQFDIQFDVDIHDNDHSRKFWSGHKDCRSKWHSRWEIHEHDSE